ncbi:MAG: hypothetical protein ACREOZ_01015, partial [Gloeomargaritales cyanobacterium]
RKPIGFPFFPLSGGDLKSINELKLSTTALNNKVTDPQVRFQRFKPCVQPKIAHLELPDMLWSPASIADSTDFSKNSASNTQDFLKILLYGQHSNRRLSQLSYLQAIQPVSKGGLGLRSTDDSRVGRFLV